MVRRASSPLAASTPTEAPASEVRRRHPLSAVPRLSVTLEGLHSLTLDASTAYLLSLVDGRATVEDILELAREELQRDEALVVLARLVQLGAIELRDR